MWAAKARRRFRQPQLRPHRRTTCRSLKDAHAAASGSKARVIAKIEKPEALDQLDEIVDAADGVMVARGDLGVEIDVAEMPSRKSGSSRACQRHAEAGDHRHADARQHAPLAAPTRAEATDVANAILDGADACMLSGETAIGEYPVEAVEMMNRIAMATEELRQRPPMVGEVHQVAGLQPVTQAVVVAACDMARSLDAKLMVVASRTGRRPQPSRNNGRSCRPSA